MSKMRKFPKVKKPNLTACFQPKECWYSKEVNASGKRGLVFSPEKALFPNQSFLIRCKRCLGCRMHRSAQWAFRCWVEAKSHSDNAFLTLTYHDANLPMYGSLVKRHPQLFFKKLRKAISPQKLRYFMCGEYGDLRQRPHYHVCLFGFDFPDKRPVGKGSNGDVLYQSDMADSIWGHGRVWIGNLTFQSAAYTARYILKKALGPDRHEVDEAGLLPYERITEFGEIIEIQAEYAAMSNRPGVGAAWYERFKSDVWPQGTVVHKGSETGAPEYFKRLLERENPELYERVMSERRAFARKAQDHPDHSPDRLEQREAAALNFVSKGRGRNNV